MRTIRKIRRYDVGEIVALLNVALLGVLGLVAFASVVLI